MNYSSVKKLCLSFFLGGFVLGGFSVLLIQKYSSEEGITVKLPSGSLTVIPEVAGVDPCDLALLKWRAQNPACAKVSNKEVSLLFNPK